MFDYEKKTFIWNTLWNVEIQLIVSQGTQTPNVFAYVRILTYVCG